MLPFDSIVFIVNADRDSRLALECAVVGAGFSAVAFDSVAEYLAYPRPDLPACHLLDINLPDMSGLVLQTLIVSGEAVVFVSRQAHVQSSTRASRAGAFDFLTAPYDVAELLRAIRSAIDQADRKRAEQQRIAALRRRWSNLTSRERQVLQLIISGYLNKQAASELGISEITVKAHRGHVMAKMLASSFADLVRMATLLDVPIIGGRRGSVMPSLYGRSLAPTSAPATALHPPATAIA